LRHDLSNKPIFIKIVVVGFVVGSKRPRLPTDQTTTICVGSNDYGLWGIEIDGLCGLNVRGCVDWRRGCVVDQTTRFAGAWFRRGSVWGLNGRD